MPSSNTITTFYTFSAGDLIRSSYVNTNFSNYRGHLLPIDPSVTSSPDMTYDLGGDKHSWLNNYSGVWAAGAQSTPAGNPSTTTQYKLYMKSDGLLYKLTSLGVESVFAGTGALPGTTKGDLAVHDGSATVRFPVGSNGQVLTADSSATAGVKWADVGSLSVVLATAAVSVLNTNDLVICSGSSFTATLFSITGNDGQEIELLHNGNNLTNVYTIRTSDTDVISTFAGDTTTVNMYTKGERFKLLVSGGKFVIRQHEAETSWVDAGSYVNFYTFTISSGNATLAATYTNNGQTFTVAKTIAGGTTLICRGTGDPAASGTLTKSAGTGDATLTFSSFAGSAYNISATTTPPTLHGDAVTKLLWKRSGQTITQRFYIEWPTAGVAGSGDYLLPFVTNTTIDTNIHPVDTSGTAQSSAQVYTSNLGFVKKFIFGFGYWQLTSGNYSQSGIAVLPYSSSAFRLYTLYTGGGPMIPMGSTYETFSNGASSYHVEFSYAVSGWQP